MLHRRSRTRDRDKSASRVRPGSFASGARLFWRAFQGYWRAHPL